jgi:Domain of unknown function (DUF6438)
MVLWLLALAACSPRTPASGGPPTPYSSADAGAADTPVITLERMPCFGTCPVYQVSIGRSGAVRFVGKHHVTTQGTASAEIPAERVDSLLGALERGGYFGFADTYMMDAPACGMYATDSPTVITSVSAGGRSKTIRHDYGCHGAPRELATLERLIDDVAGTDQWTGRE